MSVTITDTNICDNVIASVMTCMSLLQHFYVYLEYKVVVTKILLREDNVLFTCLYLLIKVYIALVAIKNKIFLVILYI